MLVHDIDSLLTFNLQDFRRYSEITLLTPEEAVKQPPLP